MKKSLRACLYLRISVDRDGKQTATSRQRADCLKFAKARGWRVVEEFEDVDASAWKRRVKRPQFERMLTAVREGEFDVVLAWKFDRVLRSVRDFARLKDAADDGNAFIVDMFGVDTSTLAGRMQAGLMAVFAEAESENISIRVARKHEESARAGRPHVGGPRTFGYSRDLMTINQEEAALIRDAVKRVYAGESLHGIVTEWNTLGIKTTRGNQWRTITLRLLLMSPTLSAQREIDGELIKGIWPAILKPTDTTRLRAILRDPARRLSQSTGRKYLLSGILTCGICDTPMAGRPNKGVPNYICKKSPGSPACGGVFRKAEPVDEYVTEMVLRTLDGVDLRAPSQAGPAVEGVADQIQEAEAALSELIADYYQRRALPRAQFLANKKVLEEKVRSLRERLAAESGTVMPLARNANARKEWGERDIHWRRSLVSAAVESIRVLPIGKTGQHEFDPGFIEIAWKT